MAPAASNIARRSIDPTLAESPITNPVQCKWFQGLQNIEHLQKINMIFQSSSLSLDIDFYAGVPEILLSGDHPSQGHFFRYKQCASRKAHDPGPCSTGLFGNKYIRNRRRARICLPVFPGCGTCRETFARFPAVARLGFSQTHLERMSRRQQGPQKPRRPRFAFRPALFCIDGERASVASYSAPACGTASTCAKRALASTSPSTLGPVSTGVTLPFSPFRVAGT